MNASQNEEQQMPHPIAGIFLAIAILGIAEALVYTMDTLYMSIYLLGIVFFAFSVHQLLQEEISVAKQQENQPLAKFSMAMYLPLAGILYLLVTRFVDLFSMVS